MIGQAWSSRLDAMNVNEPTRQRADRLCRLAVAALAIAGCGPDPATQNDAGAARMGRYEYAEGRAALRAGRRRRARLARRAGQSSHRDPESPTGRRRTTNPRHPRRCPRRRSRSPARPLHHGDRAVVLGRCRERRGRLRTGRRPRSAGCLRRLFPGPVLSATGQLRRCGAVVLEEHRTRRLSAQRLLGGLAGPAPAPAATKTRSACSATTSGSSRIPRPVSLDSATRRWARKPPVLAAAPAPIAPVDDPEGPLFGAPKTVASYAAATITVADVDGDGRLDLVLTGGNGPTVLEGVGDGYRPSATQPFAGAGAVRSILWGDLDDDGLLDAVMCTPDGPHALASTSRERVESEPRSRSRAMRGRRPGRRGQRRRPGRSDDGPRRNRALQQQPRRYLQGARRRPWLRRRPWPPGCWPSISTTTGTWTSPS